MGKRIYYAPANIRSEKYQRWMEEREQEATNEESEAKENIM